MKKSISRWREKTSLKGAGLLDQNDYGISEDFMQCHTIRFMSQQGFKLRQQEYRPDIDGLRAVAISSVLAFHTFPQLLSGGFLGVDVFFVISGFLIAGIVLREQAAGMFILANFYHRRVRRIFPALIVVLLACLGMGMVGLFDVEFLQLARHAFFGAFGLANLSLYKDTGYFSLTAETNPLLHLWSLGVEEQFYLLLPPLVLILGGRVPTYLPTDCFSGGVRRFSLAEY